MRWFEITTVERGGTLKLKYCVQAYDFHDAIDWVLESSTTNVEYILTLTELFTEVEVVDCQLKSDIVFWGG